VPVTIHFISFFWWKWKIWYGTFEDLPLFYWKQNLDW